MSALQRANPRELYRMLLTVGRKYPVRIFLVWLICFFLRKMCALRCGGSSLLSLLPDFSGTRHHLMQDYNIRHYILRRTKTEFRKHAGLKGEEATAKLQEVSMGRIQHGLSWHLSLPLRQINTCFFLYIPLRHAGLGDAACY